MTGRLSLRIICLFVLGLMVFQPAAHAGGNPLKDLTRGAKRMWTENIQVPTINDEVTYVFEEIKKIQSVVNEIANLGHDGINALRKDIQSTLAVYHYWRQRLNKKGNYLWVVNERNFHKFIEFFKIAKAKLENSPEGSLDVGWQYIRDHLKNPFMALSIIALFYERRNQEAAYISQELGWDDDDPNLVGYEKNIADVMEAYHWRIGDLNDPSQYQAVTDEDKLKRFLCFLKENGDDFRLVVVNRWGQRKYITYAEFFAPLLQKYPNLADSCTIVDDKSPRAVRRVTQGTGGRSPETQAIMEEIWEKSRGETSRQRRGMRFKRSPIPPRGRAASF